MLPGRGWFTPTPKAMRDPSGDHAGPSAPSSETIALRNIVCALAAAGMFHRVLTPGYDAAHESHLHLDIARDAKAMSVR